MTIRPCRWHRRFKKGKIEVHSPRQKQQPCNCQQYRLHYLKTFSPHRPETLSRTDEHQQQRQGTQAEKRHKQPTLPAACHTDSAGDSGIYQTTGQQTVQQANPERGAY